MHTHSKTKDVSIGLPRIALVGNPNVGKSVIFHLLTGHYVTVSNYPGTTVEVTRGHATLRGKKYEVLDTPGINSLVPMSEDEQVSRDILLKEPPAAVVQVADTKNLKRALLITLQLSEMNVPTVLNLNMWDEAQNQRIAIDVPRLSSLLGVPVVPTVAIHRKGTNDLIAGVAEARCSSWKIRYDPKIEEAIERIEHNLADLPVARRALALMILSGDLTVRDWLLMCVSSEHLNKIETILNETQAQYGRPLGYVINEQRSRAAEDLAATVIRREEKPKSRWSERIGAWAMHPVWGVPVMLLVLLAAWFFVGEFGAGTAVGWIEEDLFGTMILPAVTDGVTQLSPWDFFTRLLVGPYGIITMALTYALAIVFPIILTFFLFFSIVEDSGYLPRLAIMSNRIFKTMGLNGKAVLPMVLGLGCDTMATLTSRILETRRERLIVILLLTLGVPCSAQLGVIWGMIGSPFTAPGAIWLGTVMLVIFIVGYLASKILPGKQSDFILEIPPIRWPSISNILTKTFARLEWYLKEAVPLFVMGTLVLFVLNELGWLAVIQNLLSPLVEGLLGLPRQCSEAFVMGFLRRDYGAAGMFAMKDQLTTNQIVVSMVTITLFVPCIAQFFVTIKERGLKTALVIAGFVLVFAFGVGAAMNAFFRWTGINL